VGAFEDAVARIRGPQLSDLLADHSVGYDDGGYPVSQDSSVAQSTEVSPAAPLRAEDPHEVSVSDQPTRPAWRSVGRSWDEPTFTEKYVKPYVAEGARIAGTMGGAFLGSFTPVGPVGGAMLGAALVEPGAQAYERDVLGEDIERPYARGALNVAFAPLGGAAKYAPVRPLARAGVTVLEGAALGEAYEISRGLLEEGKVDWQRVSTAGKYGAAFSVPFAGIQAGYTLASKKANVWSGDRLDEHAKAAASLHNEEGWASYNPAKGGDLRSVGGYAVGVPGRSELVPKGDDIEVAFRNFAEKNQDLLETGLFGIGSWTPDDGRGVVLDVVANPASRARAQWLGKRWDQEAIGDLNTGDVVPIGKSGALDRGPMDPQRAIYDLAHHPVGDVLEAAEAAMGRVRAFGRTRLAGLARRLAQEEIGSVPGARPEERTRFRSVEEINAAIQGPLRKGTTLYNDVVSVGTGHVLNAPDFDGWAARMKEEFPNLADDQLTPLYEQARGKFGKFMAKSLLKVPEVADHIRTLERKGINAAGGSWLRTRQVLEDLGFPKDTIDHLNAFLQVTSANKSLPANVTTALQVFSNWYEGKPATEGIGLTPAMKKMVETVAAEGPREVGELKIRDFLNYETDPNVVVVDRRVWKDMLKMPGDGPGGSHEYRVAAAIVRDLAKTHGETPREFFSHAWVGVGVESGRQSRGYGDVIKQRLLARDAITDRVMRILEPESKLAADEIRAKIEATLSAEEKREAARWIEGIATRALPPGEARTFAVRDARRIRASADGQLELPVGNQGPVGPKPKAKLTNEKGERAYTTGLAMGEGAEASGRFFNLKGKTLDDLHARDPEAGKAIFEAMGARLKKGDTNPDLKIYPLAKAFGTTREEVDGKLGAWLDSVGWKYKVFGPGEDGKGWTPPDFKTDSYHNRTVWIYQPADPKGSFRDYAYTLPWRVTHEVAHGMVNERLTKKYGGVGRRQGALGRVTTAPNGKEAPPLSLADALRAIEWEHETFKLQRKLLKDLGVDVTDAQFARENQVNMADAVYRALSGDFSSPGDWGVLPQPLPPNETLARAKGLLRRAARDMNLDTTERFGPRVRPGQAGKVRLDALWAAPRLAVWGAHQVLRGVVAPVRLARHMVETFGPAVSRAASAAVGRAMNLLRGARGAMESVPNVDPSPVIERPEPFAQGEGRMPDDRVGKWRDRFKKYGKAGRLMHELLEDHADLINEQTRGVVNDRQLQELADQIKVDMVRLAGGERPAPGTAASAEEIKRMTDLVYSLDKAVAAKLKDKQKLERTGAWSPADEAELVSLTNGFVNAHAVLAGQSAEAGRALRAHQVSKKLRNRDLEAFLSYSRMRGLSPEEIAKVMASHQDPLSRAKAVQTLTKLTAGKLYVHARYYTMLMDPATWINAGFGNAIDASLRELGKLPGAVADKMFRRGSRMLYAREINPRTVGLLTGVRKGWERALHVLREGVDPASIEAGKAPPEELFAGRGPALELLGNLPFRALSAADAFSTSMAATTELHGFAFARAMKRAVDQGFTGTKAEEVARELAAQWVQSPPEWLLTHVDRMSRQISLQAPLGRMMGQIDRGLKEHPVVASFIAPFLRTSVNVVKQAGKKTPLGLAQSVRLSRAARTPEAARALARRRGISLADVDVMEAGDPGAFQDSLRREAAVVAGEGALGTAAIVAMPLLLMAGFGDITGDPPKDHAEAARLGRERPFNAVRVGDVWVAQRSFGSLEPILRSVGNAKQAFEIVKRKKAEGTDEYWSRAADAFTADLTGLLRSGPLGALDNLQRIQDAGTSEQMMVRLGEYFKGFTIVGEVADKVQRYRDPYNRRVEGFFDPMRRAFNPGSLAPRLDPLGDPVPKRPLPIVKQVGSRPDDLLNEAAKAGVAISAPDESRLKLEDREVLLSLDDRRVLNRALGLANRYALQKVVGDRAEWAAMDPEERKRELTYWRDSLRGDVRRAATDALEGGRRLSLRDLIQVLEDSR
jgi:hypothetical protein